MAHGYLIHPENAGYQPPAREALTRGSGALKFHALGCRVDGGAGLPPGRCRKCREDQPEAMFVRSLMRADHLAGAR